MRSSPRSPYRSEMGNATPRRPSRSRSRSRTHLSREGVTVLALAVLLGAAAINSGTNLIYLLSATLLGLFIVGWGIGIVTLSGLRAARRHPSSVFAKERMSVEIILENRKRTFGACAVRAREVGGDSDVGGWAPRIAPRGSHRITYRTSFPSRGRREFDGLEVTTLFPFGLLKRRRVLAVKTEVIVLPEVRPFLRKRNLAPTGGKVLQRQSWVPSDEEEFHGVREYREGDNPRRIHWKSSARTGNLMVKDLRQRKRDRVIVILDSGVPAGSPDTLRQDLERGVILAASILHDAHRRGRAFTLITHVPDLADFPVERGRAHLYRLLECLACLEPPKENRRAAVLRQARLQVTEMDEVWFLSLGGIPSGAVGRWDTVDLARGEDRGLLGKEGGSVGPARP
ncbi:MAG: DUF58 domain-containing protein [Planctomycetota bacterium]|nr:DUF58 domain-containing protein [Planctomycetota bacterium]